MVQSPDLRASGQGTENATGVMELGPAEAIDQGVRIPIYLEAGSDLAMAGLTLSLGTGTSAHLRWLAGEAAAPTLADSGVAGSIVMAWLDGLQLSAGQKLLLGYVALEGASGQDVTLSVIHLDATRGNDDESIPLAIRTAASRPAEF